MKRILIAVGTLAAVVVLGVGAVNVIGSTGEPTPQPTTASTQDVARPLDSEAVTEQSVEQSRAKQAAVDDLAKHVREEAERIRDAQ